MQRWRPLLLAIVIAASASTGAIAQQPSKPTAHGAMGHRAMGLLIRNPDTDQGEPPFAITDQYGRVQRFVEPSPGLDLDRYVGERVRIKHDTGRTLLASQLELPTGGAPKGEPQFQLREVSPAQFVPPKHVASLNEPRLFNVIPTQATVDGGEAIDLDKVLARDAQEIRDAQESSSESLPSPARGGALAPIPADDYYPEGSYPEGTYSQSPYPEASSSEVIDMEVVDGGHFRSRVPRRARSGPMPLSMGDYGVDTGCVTCNPPSQRGLYARADYLLWWFDGMATPPLVTTNDLGDVPALGNPGTRVVYGGETLDDARHGARFTIGAWLDDCRDFAVEGDYLFFGTESDAFSYNDPTGAGNFGRPFYSTTTVIEDGEVVQEPGQDALSLTSEGSVGGSFDIITRSEFQSFGLRLRTGVACNELGGGQPTCGCPDCARRGPPRGGSHKGISRIDFIAGYRYLELEESHTSYQLQTILVSTPIEAYRYQRSLGSDNEFNGVDLGYVYDLQSQRWGLELTGKVALGGTRQRVVSAASFAAVGVPDSFDSASDSFARTRFSAIPELSARLAYRVTPQLSLSAAYTLLYWANVVRSGDVLVQYTPQFDWEETSLWAHGLNFGLDYNY